MELKEYLRLKKQIEDKYKQEIDALDLLWKNYGSKDSNSSDTSSKRNLSDAVREVLRALGDRFSITEVANGLKDLGYGDISGPQLSNTMNRLSNRREIILVAEGKGRSPNYYRLAAPNESRTIAENQGDDLSDLL